MFDKNYYKIYVKDNISWNEAYRKRQFFLRAMAKSLKKFHPSFNKVIDVGCGLGFFSYQLMSRYSSIELVTGDISDYSMTVTKLRLSEFNNVTIIPLNAEELYIPENSADVIVCFDVVEHLQVPEKFFDKAFKILRPGGLLLFTTPNLNSLGSRIKGNVPRAIGKEHCERSLEWCGWRDDSHINIRGIGDWRSVCRSAGFVLVRDGSDGCWDTPYFKGVPLILQKLLFNGSHRILTGFFPVLPWSLGENYIGFWRKQ
jgi:SAM-dependent methyltransferase